MENQNQNTGFSYTYSAREQEELKRIREKYAPTEESKMERLQRLDRSATKKAECVSLILGVIGVLILGLGMSLAMSELGEILGSHRALALPLGILIGVLGGALVCLAYPMYNWILKRERHRIAPEILRLADELMK